MIDEILKYANIIENDGIEYEELIKICNLLYKIVGELKENDKKISAQTMQISWLNGIVKTQENKVLQLETKINDLKFLCEKEKDANFKTCQDISGLGGSLYYAKAGVYESILKYLD